MTKKRPHLVELDETGAVVALDETGAVVALDESDVADGSGAPFVLNKWNGLTQWRCRFCAWDTLDGEAEAMDHYITQHAAPTPPREGTIVVYDRFGRPVV